MSAQPLPLPPWGQTLFGGGVHTAADVERMPDDGYHYEVFRGLLLRMPGTGVEHGFICQTIGRLLDEYWRARGERFRIVQNVGFDFTFPGDAPRTTMLVPDVAVLATNTKPTPTISQQAPLIAIEVASPSDFRPEMDLKAQFYLNAGVVEVWIVWPKTRTIDVWLTTTTMTTFHDQQTVQSSHLPGFDPAVASCFDG